jgi:hypothetical protein
LARPRGGSLNFAFAEIPFRITPGGQHIALSAPPEYEKFLITASDRPPATIYETALADTLLPPEEATKQCFWDNGLWRTSLNDNHSLEIDIFDTGLNRWRKAACMSPDFSSGTLWTPHPQPDALSVRPLYHPQDRAIIIGRLCHLGGVMMHSSSIIENGRIMLFSGVSGAGKTTMARLWRQHGATILNDERNMIHTAHGSVRAGASPWHGEENEVDPATGPLSAIFFLKQATVNQLRPMPLPESLGRMLTTAFVPVYLPDGPARTLDACTAILQTVPAYELSFTPDVRALELCRSV